MQPPLLHLIWSVLTNEIFVLVMFLNSCYYTVTLCSQQSLCAPDYKRRHFLCLFLIGWGRNTALTASSNTCGERESWLWWLLRRGSLTCLRPLWVRAEHSRYLTDRILFASFCPCSLLMGECPLSARACRASLSSLRSILVPENNKIFFYSENIFICSALTYQ